MSKPKDIGNKIILLYEQGFSYKEICKKLNCSKGTVSYHCGKGQKTKTLNRQQSRRKNNPLIQKLEKFKSSKYKDCIKEHSKLSFEKILYHKINTFTTGQGMKNFNFTVDDIKNKIGNNPTCYLSGRKIDLSKSRTYQLDHVIPISRGGDNSLENCKLTCSEANQAKHNLTNDEFIKLCKDVLINNGYKVELLSIKDI